jgi:hypothetical protein
MKCIADGLEVLDLIDKNEKKKMIVMMRRWRVT